MIGLLGGCRFEARLGMVATRWRLQSSTSCGSEPDSDTCRLSSRQHASFRVHLHNQQKHCGITCDAPAQSVCCLTGMDAAGVNDTNPQHHNNCCACAMHFTTEDVLEQIALHGKNTVLCSQHPGIAT